MNPPLTHQQVSAILPVDDCGNLSRIATSGSEKPGPIARHVNQRNGYLTVNIGNKRHQAHRVVGLLTHGEWPATYVDHKDCVKQNNHPSNRRLCSNAQNIQNRGPNKRNSTGFTGVTWVAKKKRYQVTCGSKYVGFFPDLKQAARAYDEAAAKRFGEFARLNFESNA